MAESPEDDLPQPLSKVKPGAGIIIGPHALDHVPQLTPYILRVIAEWSHIDATFGVILTNLLRADFMIVTEMYQALTGSTARDTAFRAAARKALSKDDNRLLHAALKVISGSRKRRNDFAHHTWAWSDDVPDAALLFHPGVLHRDHAQWQEHTKDQEQKWFMTKQVGKAVQFIVRPPPLNDGFSQVFVFKEADLKRDVREAGQAHAHVTHLYHVLSNTGESEQSRKLLLRSHRIQEALEALSKQNAQQAHPPHPR